MDPFTLAIAAGAVFLLMTTGGKKKKKAAALRPGDHQLKIGQEYTLQLPRDGGYWQKIPVGGPPVGEVQISARPADPLNVARALPKAPGLVKVSFFTDDKHQDLVAEYLFDIRA